ncbi:EscU/YscU/HrcU family type III secretion system export apparatus switch protein [Mesorhizobium sp. M1A.F.Ca.IN.022.05.2.1]|uniref:EscU/YscU/HrcU family type III secretion system export apparatus switch protein n=1 Tax=Mesorhizobium sp. M1A.F.Ca.IN.022.05.2.1 TaxID=2496760 RepID=UPI000FCC5632|nr:EscU/YscU/HrcU family type III secretion system export apparatus switch protein [Mesorhizobium sp. M1A.F.Ca.IN.022.05.2.1]RUW05704.1 EscU/YscU/HrcU family type III secretion system export apparatus switch protein [Mesorhizobium sp. M1A.F.Ca.IN.022.05.2.1]
MSGEKTEKPTPKRVRDLRRKGQVAQSNEVVSAALTIAFFALFFASLPGMIDRLEAMILTPIPLLESDVLSVTQQLLQSYISELQRMLAPFVGIVLVIGVGANVLQNGLIFSPQAAAPALKHLSPSENAKRIVSLGNCIELGKSIGKILVIGSVLLLVLREGMRALVWTPSCGIRCLRSVTGSLLLGIAVYAALSLLMVAIAHFAFQRWQFTKRNMMSKAEVKREYKEENGAPTLIAHRKQLHMELLSKGMIDQSRRATVLITNPTHVAVAIYYNRQQTPLPLISAVGTDLTAQDMIDAAVATAVPVMRNVPLAQALLKHGRVDEYIPSHLLVPVAEVLRALGNLATEAGVGPRFS